MMIAKYFGLKKGGTEALILSKRSWNQAADFAKLGNVSVCLQRGPELAHRQLETLQRNRRHT